MCDSGGVSIGFGQKGWILKSDPQQPHSYTTGEVWVDELNMLDILLTHGSVLVLICGAEPWGQIFI